MTRQEILNTPEIVDFMIDKSVMVDSKMKLHKRLEELCKLAIKALEQQSCEDCISRQAAIEAIYDCYIGGKDAIKNAPINDLYADGLAEAVDAVWDMPSVTPTRPTGRWIDIQYFKNDDTYYRPKCPFCSIEPKEYSNYCPNCGARMIESEDEYADSN